MICQCFELKSTDLKHIKTTIYANSKLIIGVIASGQAQPKELPSTVIVTARTFEP